MRPGQNKRIRGRSNRKGPNPLTRSFESNGPDVKIRGTAQHVAEKYLQLARDAQSSGDTIMAERLLQHAEHYFRLIAAAQSAQQQTRDGYGRQEADADIGEDEDDQGSLPDRFAPLAERLPPPPAYQPQPYQAQQPPAQTYFAPQPQPHIAQQPQPFEERPIGEPRQHDRPPRPERGFRDRGRDRGGERAEGGERAHQGFDRNRDSRRFPPRAEPVHQNETRAGNEVAGPGGLPSFITAPVKNPGVDPDVAEPVVRPERPTGREHEDNYHLDARRRRRPRPPLDEQAGNGAAPNGEPPHSDDELPLGD